MSKPGGTTYSVVGGFDTPDRYQAILLYRMLGALNLDGARVRVQIFATTREGDREIREPVQVDE